MNYVCFDFLVLVLAEVLIVEGFDEKPNNILVSFEDKPRDASNVSYVLFWHDKNKKVSEEL